MPVAPESPTQALPSGPSSTPLYSSGASRTLMASGAMGGLAMVIFAFL